MSSFLYLSKTGRKSGVLRARSSEIQAHAVFVRLSDLLHVAYLDLPRDRLVNRI